MIILRIQEPFGNTTIISKNNKSARILIQSSNWKNPFYWDHIINISVFLGDGVSYNSSWLIVCEI